MDRSNQGSGVKVLRKLRAVPFAALLLLVSIEPAHAQFVQTHHVRREVANGQARFLNRLPGTQTLQIDMVLPLRDQAGLDSFLREVYDPTSPILPAFPDAATVRREVRPLEAGLRKRGGLRQILWAKGGGRLLRVERHSTCGFRDEY